MAVVVETDPVSKSQMSLSPTIINKTTTMIEGRSISPLKMRLRAVVAVEEGNRLMTIRVPNLIRKGTTRVVEVQVAKLLQTETRITLATERRTREMRGSHKPLNKDLKVAVAALNPTWRHFQHSMLTNKKKSKPQTFKTSKSSSLTTMHRCQKTATMTSF